MLISQEPITPNTIILQPESLDGSSGRIFQQALEQALTQASGVIVDLLWVETIDSEGLNLLAQSMVRSQASGKDITFLGLEYDDKLEVEHRVKSSSPNSTLGHGIFAPDFEAFLDRHRDLKASEALI